MDDILKKIYEFKKKNRKIIMSVLLLIIIPSICSLAFGIEMQENQIKSIPTVIFDNDHSAFSRMLVDEIETNDIFNIKYNVESNNEVEQLIDNNQAMMGVIIPKGFYEDIITAEAPKVLIFYDGSSMAVTSAAKSRMNEILLTLKAGYMKKIIEGKLNVVSQEALKQIQPITPTYRLLYNPTRNYRNFLLPGMLVSIAQLIIVMVGAEKGNEIKGNVLSYFKTSMKWGSISAITLILSIGIQILFFNLPYEGTILGGLVLTLMYSIGITSLGILVRLIIKDRTFSTQLACFLVLPTSILGGYTFPLFAMPKAIQNFSFFLSYTHYTNTLRDLLMKPLSLYDVKGTLFLLTCFVGVMWLGFLGVYILKYRKEERKGNIGVS